MPKITYIEVDGREHVVEGELGASIMETAKKNGVPGIDADCGGNCSCGTCHVYIEPDWAARVGPRTPLEEATLEFATDVQANSRLSCQIKLSEHLDGLVLRMPATQR